jgi:hypothetical protein
VGVLAFLQPVLLRMPPAMVNDYEDGLTWVAGGGEREHSIG